MSRLRLCIDMGIHVREQRMRERTSVGKVCLVAIQLSSRSSEPRIVRTLITGHMASATIETSMVDFAAFLALRR
jgi:hypothetical protein